MAIIADEKPLPESLIMVDVLLNRNTPRERA